MKLQITGPKHLQYSALLGTTIIDKSEIIWDSSELNAVSSNKYENTLIQYSNNILLKAYITITHQKA